MTTFAIGTVYSTTLHSDSTCEVWWTVTGRNGDMLTLEDKRGKVSSRKAIRSGDTEICFPNGRASGIMLDASKVD